MRRTRRRRTVAVAMSAVLAVTTATAAAGTPAAAAQTIGYPTFSGPPEIFYINNKIYVGLTDMQVKKVYIFDSNAQLLGNSPVYGASAIDLREGSNGVLEFVTQGEKDKIIVYQM